MARRRAVVVSQAAGWSGIAVAGPAVERPLGGVGDGVLGELPVAGGADQRGDDAQPVGGQGVGERTMDGVVRAPRPPSVTPWAARLVTPEGPQLEPAEAGHRVLGGDLDRLVEVGALEDVEADDPLARLGERAVGHEHLAAAHADGRGVGDRPHRVADHPGAAGVVRSTQSSTSSSAGSPVGGSGSVSVQTNIMYFTGAPSVGHVVHHHDGRDVPDPTTRGEPVPYDRSMSDTAAPTPDLPHWRNPAGMPDDLLPYSLSVTYGGLVRTAGLVAMDYTTGAPASHTDFVVQVRATMENMRLVLDGAGTSFDRVLETSCYLHDMGRWDEMNAIYEEYFAHPRPVRTTIETRLVPPYLFEISAVAVARDGVAD